MTCRDAGPGACPQERGLCLRTSEPPVRTGRMLRGGWAPALGFLGPGTACRAQPHAQACHELCSRGGANTDPRPLLHAPSPPSSLRLIQNHSFLFKEEQKYINKKQQGAFGFTKRREGGKHQSRHPASGRSRGSPAGSTAQGRQGGLPANPVSHQSPRPQG